MGAPHRIPRNGHLKVIRSMISRSLPSINYTRNFCFPLVNSIVVVYLLVETDDGVKLFSQVRQDVLHDFGPVWGWGAVGK